MFRLTRLAGFAMVASVCATAGPAFAQRSVHVHTSTPSAHANTNTSGKASTPHFIQRIDANPQLVAKLTPLLPSGMTLDQAATGFRSEGRFIAALHASHDLNIPFAQLKAEMTGTDHDSLSQAIHELQPSADAKTAAHTAEQEARADVQTQSPTFIQRIDANPQLVAKLTPLLPPGTTLDQAAAGFRNQGQFIAALHASHDLNIPFAQLKAEMTGTDHDSLGQAIHELQPTANAKTAAQTAEQEARTDLTSTRPPKVAGTDHDVDD